MKSFRSYHGHFLAYYHYGAMGPNAYRWYYIVHGDVNVLVKKIGELVCYVIYIACTCDVWMVLV